MAFNGNLNKFKHRNKRRKNPNAQYDKNRDEYGFVSKLCGDKHIVVQLLDGHSTLVKACIPGKFFKKVWFRPNDLLVVTMRDKIWEIKGRVDENNLAEAKLLMQQQVTVEKTDQHVVIKFEEAGETDITFCSNESDDENDEYVTFDKKEESDPAEDSDSEIDISAI